MVYSNCCCICSFEPEIIKIGQSSHQMYSNNIVNFQVSMTILNACTKMSGNLFKVPRILSCSSASTDFPDSFFPFVSIIHRFQPVFETISCICIELLQISSCESSNTCTSVGRVHWRTSPMSSSLLLPLCPACPVRLIWMVLEIGGWLLYSCCTQDLFDIVPSVLVQFPSSFFSLRLVNVHVVHRYSIESTRLLLVKNAFYFIG